METTNSFYKNKNKAGFYSNTCDYFICDIQLFISCDLYFSFLFVFNNNGNGFNINKKTLMILFVNQFIKNI